MATESVNRANAGAPAFASVDPSTGQALETYPGTPADEIARIVERAHEAFLVWRKTSFAERSVPIRRVAHMLLEHERKYGAIMSREMGKPIRGAVDEVRACAWLCDHFAEYAESMLAREPIPTSARKSYVTFNPLGVILGVEPWNWPFHQVFRVVVPALMAGNAVVVKHASNVPGCALAIEDIFHKAGIPQDLLRML